MYRDNDRYRTFSRRAVFLFSGKFVLMSGLIGRMYYLQVIEGDRYKTLADENRISLKLLAPPRGRIVDRFGRPLAVNQQNYRILLVPENVPDLQRTFTALSSIVPISEGERKRIKREIKRRRRFLPIVIRENLTWPQVARIEANSPELPGLVIDIGESRFYPDGEAAAAVIGYVSGVAEKDFTGDPLLELPGFRIGKAGMEKVHDLALRGKGGTSQVEVNAVGREIRELERAEGRSGSEAWLTIDRELQNFVSRRLGGESASAVVIDVHTGEVLSLVSTPSFDPNAFNRGLSRAEWKKLISNPRTPLNNKAIAGQYAPGSTFKMIVALAALEKGVVSPRTRFFCNGGIELGNATFHCWKKNGHGAMDMVRAIAQSCDVYFYEIARKTGIDRIASMARRFGMGQVLGVGLPGEKRGLIPTRAWKRQAKGTSWQQGETVLAGIGQGFILTTPLQLAVMISRLVNGGRAVVPSLTRQIISQSEDEPQMPVTDNFEKIGIHPTHLELVERAMTAVTNSPIGTAFKARIKNGQQAMGGKTGTVQVRRISKAERETGVLKNKDLEWHERDHAVFVGYAPVATPRYAVSVVVEHGGSGSSSAAPIARDILLEVQRRDPSGKTGDSQARLNRKKQSGLEEG